MHKMIISALIIMEIIISVKSWQCVSPIRKAYSRVNSSATLQFTADLQDLLTLGRQFEFRFYDGTPKARITFYTDKDPKPEAAPGVSITGDRGGNVVVTLANVQENNAGIYIMITAGFATKCSCLHILGTPIKPTVTVNKTPSVGESVTLTCSSTSTITPSNHSLSLTYSWRVDNTDNPGGMKYSYTPSKDKLTVNNIVKEDANKQFTCTATEVVTGGYTSNRSEPSSFYVYYGPDNVVFSPSDTSYEKDENESLNEVTCSASCYPTCSFKWTITETGRIISSSAILNLGKLQSSDVGTYRCTATRSGGSPQSKDLSVNVIYGPNQSSTKLSPSTQKYTTNEGQSLNDITCSADCYPDCTYTWNKTRQGQTTTVSSTDVLSIGTLHRENAALYACIVKNPEKISSSTTTIQTLVNVRYGPDSANLSKTSPRTVTEGDKDEKIECTSDCYPGCSYKWTKNTSSSAFTSLHVLQLNTVLRENAGDYKCISTNTATSQFSKSAESTIKIIVQYAPDVNISLSTTSLKEGESLTLFCNGHGVPSGYNYTSLIQSWNNVAIPNNNTAVDHSEKYSSLYFKSLRLDDTGTYMCTLNNGISNLSGILDQSGTREIIVQVSPKILKDDLRFTGSTGDAINIEIPVYSNPVLDTIEITRYDGQSISSDMYTVTNESVKTKFYGKDVTLQGNVVYLTLNDTKEEDFGNYSFKITNVIDTTLVFVHVIAEGPPLPPKFLQFLSENNILKFVWQKDFNGGLQQSFIIQTSIVGTETWTNLFNVSEIDSKYRVNSTFYTANITDLSPGKYAARIFSVNLKGGSEHVVLATTFDVVKETEPNEPTTPLAIIVGVISSVCLLFLVVGIILFVLKRRRSLNQDGSQIKLDSKKHRAVEDDDDDEDEVNTVNPMYVSADEVQSTDNVYAKPVKKKKVPEGNDIYTQVNKKKKKETKDKKNKKGKIEIEGDIYENAPTAALNDNINMKKVKKGMGKAYDENPYENPLAEETKQPKKNVNKDGLIYADLTFNDQPKGQKKLVIHGLDDMTEYVEVDFTKRADPLPDSDEEERTTNK